MLAKGRLLGFNSIRFYRKSVFENFCACDRDGHEDQGASDGAWVPALYQFPDESAVCRIKCKAQREALKDRVSCETWEELENGAVCSAVCIQLGNKVGRYRRAGTDFKNSAVNRMYKNGIA